MKRGVVNFATGSYIRGQQRLRKVLAGSAAFPIFWAAELPIYSPTHEQVPYAFKAWALKAAAELHHCDLLLWADACILPVRDLEPLWDRIATDGYWISRNGFSNAEWTVPEAYPLLGITPEENEGVEHVVATTFGISVAHPIGRQILAEYLRLAMNGSFAGPWRLRQGTRVSRGDKEISGHRHDQTAFSIIAHRLGCKLTSAPDVFAYRGGETEATLLVADATY